MQYCHFPACSNPILQNGSLSGLTYIPSVLLTAVHVFVIQLLRLQQILGGLLTYNLPPLFVLILCGSNMEHNQKKSQVKNM